MAYSGQLASLSTRPSISFTHNIASNGASTHFGFCTGLSAHNVFRNDTRKLTSLGNRTGICHQRRQLSARNRQMSPRALLVGGILGVDPWSPNIDSQSIATQLFAASLFPYLGFLYYITKSRTAPKLTLFGFYFLLAFVGATVPAGIYAKIHYGTSLSNVDWLHGSAESLLTLTNLFIVLGLRKKLREEETSKILNVDDEKVMEADKERTSV